jgi:hypothetical protein
MNKRDLLAASQAALLAAVMGLPATGLAADEADVPDWRAHVARMDAFSSAALEDIAKRSEAEEAAYAEWVLGLRLAHEDKHRSRLHIARAAILLESSRPIFEYGGTFLFDDDLREEALPYLLLARELGGEWVEDRLAGYSDEERTTGARELERIREEIRRLPEQP